METESLVRLFFDAHCCHMAAVIKHPVPDRVKPSFIILTSGHSDATHMATVGVKGLSANKRLFSEVSDLRHQDSGVLLRRRALQTDLQYLLTYLYGLGLPA